MNKVKGNFLGSRQVQKIVTIKFKKRYHYQKNKKVRNLKKIVRKFQSE
jgi:hypothetical protein